jgi:hypothetical protein
MTNPGASDAWQKLNRRSARTEPAQQASDGKNGSGVVLNTVSRSAMNKTDKRVSREDAADKVNENSKADNVVAYCQS